MFNFLQALGEIDSAIKEYVEPGCQAVALLGDLQVNLESLSSVKEYRRHNIFVTATHDFDIGGEVSSRAQIRASCVVKDIGLSLNIWVCQNGNI